MDSLIFLILNLLISVHIFFPKDKNFPKIKTPNHSLSSLTHKFKLRNYAAVNYHQTICSVVHM